MRDQDETSGAGFDWAAAAEVRQLASRARAVERNRVCMLNLQYRVVAAPAVWSAGARGERNGSRGGLGGGVRVIGVGAGVCGGIFNAKESKESKGAKEEKSR